MDVALHVIGGLSPQQPRVKVRWMTTGARAKAWCLLIYAEASLSLSLSLSLSISLSQSALDDVASKSCMAVLAGRDDISQEQGHNVFEFMQPWRVTAVFPEEAYAAGASTRQLFSSTYALSVE